VTYVDYNAQRRLRRSKLATAGNRPAIPQRSVPTDKIVPFRCTHRGPQFGRLQCNCRNANPVHYCNNPDVPRMYCLVQDKPKTARQIIYGDNRQALPITLDDLSLCATCRQKRSFRWLDQIAIGITKYLRDEDLQRLLRSIDNYLPGIPVYVEDTGGNLSRARNRVAKQIAADGFPYYFLMEEDVELTPASVVGLDAAYDLMQSDPQLASVGGCWINTRQNRLQFWSHRFVEDDHTITIQRDVPESDDPVPCQCHENFGLFRVDSILQAGWDEAIPIGHEHWEYFYRTRHMRRVALRGFEALHHNTRPGGAYNADRARNYLRIGEEKHGKRWLNPNVKRRQNALDFQRLILPPNHNRRPNILVTGSGRCGTTLAVQIAQRLGWNCTGDRLYSEDARFVLANQELLDNAEHIEDPTDLIHSLPEPWVLKDPRFARTIESWIRLFRTQRAKPLLIVMHREPDAVQSSMSAQGWTGDARALTQSAFNAYELWPWEKWLVKYEDLIAAACLVECHPLESLLESRL
jgi:hypothetical protein